MSSSVPNGPIESQSWPSVLNAHVLTSGAEPRVWGYDVESDLCRHYSMTELVVLALSGELPSPGAGRAAQIAAAFLAPASVAEAPVHAAVLVQLCGAEPRSVVGTAALGLAEQAADVLSAYGPFLGWLGGRRAESPPLPEPPSPEDREAVLRLAEALRDTGVALPGPAGALDRTGACLAVLHEAGLRSEAALLSFIVWARLPFAAAEAHAVRAGSFRDYPHQLPPFEYSEGTL